MRRLLSVVFVILIITAGGIGGVAAQENTTQETDSDENTEIEPTATPTPEEADDGPTVDPEDLWKIFKESNSAEKPEEQTLVTDLGPNLYVTDLSFDKQSETATITVVAQVTGRVTITDASALDPSKEVSVAESRALTIPRGTVTFSVPATVDDDGNQRVTVAPGNNRIYQLSNGMVDDGASIFDGRPVWKYFLYFLGAVLIGVTYYVVRRIRKEDSGAVETADGTKLTGDVQVGVVDVPEPEGGGEDDE